MSPVPSLTLEKAQNRQAWTSDTAGSFPVAAVPLFLLPLVLSPFDWMSYAETVISSTESGATLYPRRGAGV